MRYRLSDGNEIIADADFIEAHYPDAVAVAEVVVKVPRTLSVLAFRSRFTDAEKITIYTAAETNLPVRIWLDDLSASQAQTIDLIDPRIIAGVHAMEFGGLIGAGRAAEILT